MNEQVKAQVLDLTRQALPSLAAAQEHYEAGRGRVRVGIFNYPPRELASALVRQAPRVVREKLRR